MTTAADRDRPQLRRVVPRLGLAARLYLAIGGAVLLTLSASVVAWISFVALGEDQRQITQEQIPAITQSLRLARQSALIAATVPKLLTVASDEERKQVMSGLRDQQRTLLALVAELKNGEIEAGVGAPDTRIRLDSIDNASAALATALQELDRVVGEQLVLRAEMEKLVAEAVASHRRLSGLILPLLDDMAFFLVTGYRSIDDPAPAPRLTRISDRALLQYGALADLLAEGNLLFGLLTETVSVPTVALLQPLSERFVAAADRFRTAFEGIAEVENARPVIEEFHHLVELGISDGGIIDLQRQILESEAVAQGAGESIGIIALRREIIDRMINAQRLVERSRALATSLTGEVETVVEHAQASADATAAASIHSIALGQRVLLALNVASILGAILLGWAYVSRSFTEPVLKVTAAAEDFERQRFDPAVLSKIAARRDELGHLARVFLSMAEQVQARTDTLDRLVTERTQELNSKNAALEQSLKQIADELAMAQRMQLSILPRHYPQLPALEMFARMQAAREVGGDFYDIIEIDQNRVGVAIADVSDKGVPAALLMAVACTKIKSIAMERIAPSMVLEELNQTLSEDNETAMFVTVFYGVIDLAAGTFVYANGGHNAPYLLRGDAPASPLPSTGGIALGVVPELEYRERTMPLAPGDTIFLFTDGVTEAFSPAGMPFTELKLQETLFRSRGLAVERLGRHIIEDVEHHTEGAPQSDDITCVVMRYEPKHEAPDATGPAAVTAGAAAPAGAERFVARMRNDLTELARIAEEVEAFGARCRLDARTVFNVNLILDELLTNTINYGYADDGDHVIEIAIDHRDDRLTITVEDDAMPFDPLSAPAPDLDASLEDRRVGGLGIHIVRTFMDDVRYERHDGRNRIVMTKTTGAATGDGTGGGDPGNDDG